MLILRKIAETRGGVSLELPLQSFEYVVQQNQVGVCTVTVNHSDYLTPAEDLYEDFEVWYKGKLFLECTLEEYSSSLESNTLTLVLWDSLGKLAREVGDSTLILPNTFFSVGLQTTLRNRNGIAATSGVFAQLGDLTTAPFSTADIIYSILTYEGKVDLRPLETRLGQFVKVLEQKDNMYFRLRGRPYNSPTPTSRFMIDVGTLGEPAPFQLIQGQNLLKLTVNRTENIKIRGIEIFGGPAGNGARDINAWDLYEYDTLISPVLAAEGYSLEGALTGPTVPGYLIKDDAPENGYIIRKKYSEIKLEGTPSTTQIRNAGYALFLRAKREFSKNISTVEYTAEAVFDEEIYGPVFENFVSKVTHVRYRSTNNFVDKLTGNLLDDQEVFELDQDLRILAYTVRFNNGAMYYTLSLSENVEKTVYDDPQLQFYDVVSSGLQGVESGYPIGFALVPLSTTSIPTTLGTGVAADAVFDPFDETGVNDCKQFTIDNSFMVSTANERYWFVQSISAGYTWRVHREISNSPSEPLLLILKVKPIVGDWTTSSQATITTTWYEIF